MEISIGVMAYNEQDNIGNLLKALTTQKLKKVKIKEIIVVSDGSTDRTAGIAGDWSKKDSSIRLIDNKKRAGKASVINDFLRAAGCNILVLISADTQPDSDAVERLCAPLENKKIGIAGGHPVPVRADGWMGGVVRLEYMLHHRMAIKRPKFGEMIAFRKVFGSIGNTAVDEEYIAMRIMKKGYRHAYVPDAIVHNKGPETVSDFLRQRRRIYCGHLELAKSSGYKVATASNTRVLGESKGILGKAAIPVILYATLLEGLARFLGYADFLTGRKHYIWKVAKTTKKLV